MKDRGFSHRIEMIFLLSRFEGEELRQRLELGIKARTFRPCCVPIVNLFPITANPIELDQVKYEYRVEPDKQRPYAAEIFSIDQVASQGDDREPVYFQPFYSFRHGGEGIKKQTLWVANRRPSNRPGDEGTEIDISLVDLGLNPSHPPGDTLTVWTTCTNRDLPARLPFGNESGDFTMQSGAPIKSIVALVKPTAPFRPRVGKGIQWRLISHLSLNYLSLVQGGTEALQEILRLYNFNDTAYAEELVAGIANVKSSPHFARVVSANGIAFARGTHVEIEVDEERFVGGGAYLFLSVIENFLGLYSSLNSFSQLTATSRQRKGVIRRWPPRAGRRILM
jgi:type VI secretion system protein ImpG